MDAQEIAVILFSKYYENRIYVRFKRICSIKILK